MEIRIKTSKSVKDISILNTYAPHAGYKIETLKNYWNNTNAYISLIPQKYLKIWRSDNNGQVYQNEANSYNIGKWALGGKKDNGNGERLSKCCENNDLIICNTFFSTKKQ